VARPFKDKQGGYDARYAEYIARRTKLGSWLLEHKIIPNTLAKCRGKIVDFGCGVGDILLRSPPGSIGFDISPSMVERCTKLGLDVRPYDPSADHYCFAAIAPGAYQTFLMSHVLEHVPETAEVLRKILSSCMRLDFDRVVIKVPGAAGYKRDATHVTFVDRAWLAANALLTAPGWQLAELSYYPLDVEWFGRYVWIQETIIVYAR
jgi:SAM-dependent methyltransferase